MKKIILLLLVLLATTAHAGKKLGELEYDLRAVVQENDTALSWFDSSDARKWLNMSQDNIARLGFYVEKQHYYKLYQ